MIPTSDSFGRIIDCRTLVFDGQYFGLTESEVLGLAAELYSFVERSFGEACVLSWRCREKALKGLDGIAKAHIKDDEIFDISVLGDVKSDLVYDKKSLRAYDRRLMYDPVFTMGLTPFHASCDYPAYADGELAPHMGSAREYRQVLKKLFALEGRIDMGQFRRHDLEAAVFAQTDEDHDGRFRGSFYLRISCHSLGEELDDMAQRLLTLGRSVSQRLVNVNMTIGVEQSASGWNLYFAGLNIDPTHDDTEQKLRRRAEYLYLSKVGWANIISPAVSGILPQSAEPPFEALENGAVCVRLDGGVSETTLSGLKRLKSALYPAMLPAVSEFDLDYPYLRSHWENIAVLDDELHVQNDQIIFTQNGKADTDYLLKPASYINLT